MKKLNLYYACLVLIVIAAIGLRCFTNGVAHFTHDELSTLSRTGYSSFSELIHLGVEADVHPPLVQIFFHYWTALVGDQEWLVKLPSILLGFITLFQIAWITRKWFGNSAALLSVSLFSVIEFHIYHSQTARPYIFGLFFCLLFYQAWSNLLFGKASWAQVLLMSVAAAGAAYSHHFAGLATGLTGIAGLVYLTKSNYLRYLIAGAGAVLLYLPNLNILSIQLSTGGLGGPEGWLGAPAPDFLYSFVAYLLHFSWPLLIVFLTAVFLPFILPKEDSRLSPTTLPFLLLFIFLLQYGIIHWYSIHVSPVLQFSSLFFVSPLAVAAVLAGWKKTTSTITVYGIATGILITGVYSLFITRSYNRVMDTQAFEAYHDVCEQMHRQYPDAKISVLLSTEPSFQGYYMKKKHFTYFYHDYKKGFDRADLQKVLIEEQPDIVIMGNPLAGYAEELKQNGYPYLIHYQTGSVYEIYVLSKQPNSTSSTLIAKVVDGPLTDTLEVARENEWPATIRIPLDTLIEKPYDRVVAGVWIKADTSCKALIYLNFKNENGETVDFRGTAVKESFYKPGWNYVTIAVPLWVLHLKGKTSLETAVWNKEHDVFSICNFKVFAEKGNPLQYAVVEPISGKRWNW